MKHVVVRLVVAGALLSLGWAAGTAQARPGDFELRIDAPTGSVSVECLRGCGLIGAADVPNPRASQLRTYEFSCGASDRCQASIIGFLRR
jgi:hypothetical protein